MNNIINRGATGRSPLPPIVPLSRVTPERVRWLSPGRLAAGKVTILDGDPGLGKSTLLCELAARVSRGEPLPGGESAPPRSVILLSAEDDLYDTIRPRIDAAGGDPGRIIAFGVVAEFGPGGALIALPEHNDALREIIARTEAALVIVDPLVAFLSRRLNANSDQDVRRVLASLKGVAEATGAAIVAVRHLNKSANSNPLYRGGGSIGIIGAARCALLLARDPGDPERRILAATKTNLGRLPPALAFRLESAPGAGAARVVWDGDSGLTASELLSDSGTGAAMRSALAGAREWLRGALATGPRAAKDLLQEAAEAGISRSTLQAAEKAEGIRIHKERRPGGRWIWSLPPFNGQHSDAPSTSESSTSSTSSIPSITSSGP